MSVGKDWAILLEKTLKQMEKLKPEDRLGYVSAICALNIIIVNSCNGWLQWLTSPQVMDEFSEDELKQLFDFFRKIAKEFLEADQNWTRKKQKEHGALQTLSYVG